MKKVRNFSCGAAALAFFASACSKSGSGSYPDPHTFVAVPRSDFSTEFVKRTDFIVDSTRASHAVFGYLRESAYAQLPASLRTRITELDPVAFAEGTSRAKAFSQAMLPFEGRELRIDARDAEPYHTYETLSDELAGLAATHPSLFALSSIGKSVKGRDIWLVKVSDDVGNDEDEPKILFVSTMHGNEVVGQEMLVYFLRQVARDHDTDPRMKSIIEHAQIYVIPNLNPDGTAARSRFNANGVDLNRNFPDFVEDGEESPQGRAPETRAMMALLARHRMITSLTFHGGAACVNLPWDAIPNDSPEKRFGDSDLLLKMAHDYAEANGRMTEENGGNFDRGVTFGYEWYETHGNMADWASYYRGSAMMTLEVSEVKWPDARELPQFWQENRNPLLTFLEETLSGIALDVRGSEGERVPVRVTHDATRRPLLFPSGTVFRPALPGVRKVRVEAEGYLPFEFEMPAGRFQGIHFPVTLQRAASSAGLD